METRSCIKRKSPVKGRMPGDHRLIPGIYYEKVYSKSIYLTAYLSNLFRVPFDDFSIPVIREKKVFYKSTFKKQKMNKI